MPDAYAPDLASWEAFFNGDSLKEQLMSRYGIRRSDPGFWAHSDLNHDQLELLDYPDRGVLDYGRIENR